MQHIAFIVGHCDNQTDYDNLKWNTPTYSIKNYWEPRILPSHDLLVMQWNESTRNDDLSASANGANVKAIVDAIAAKWGSEQVKIFGHSYGGWVAARVAAAMKTTVFGGDPVDPGHVTSVNTTGISIAPEVVYAKSWHRPADITTTPPSGIPYPIYSTFYQGPSPRVVNQIYSKNDHGWPVYDGGVIQEVVKYVFVAPAPPQPPVSVDHNVMVDGVKYIRDPNQ